MATRSNIGMITKRRKVVVTYCHWDGYLSYNGKILLENYKNGGQVYDLVSRGSIDLLGESIESTRYLNDSVDAIWYNSLEEYADSLKDDIFIEYIYLWDCTLKCWVYKQMGDICFRALTQNAIEMEEC